MVRHDQDILLDILSFLKLSHYYYKVEYLFLSIHPNRYQIKLIKINNRYLIIVLFI